MVRDGALNDTQRRQWASDGYLVLKEALPKTMVARLLRQVDRLHRREVRSSAHAQARPGMDRRNILPDSQEFIDMIDHSSILEPVVELMGPYIQLSMAEAIVRPPNPDDQGYIHTDGGEALRRIRVSETSWPLQIKVQYFLTDLPKPGSGNFTLFPGSHLRPYPEGDNPVTTATPGAVQLCAEAGDAVIFPHALWHGVSTNHSRRARKSLIYCYSQMCFRTFDFNGHAPDLLDRCTTRQRRLLGDLSREWRPGAYFYSPEDQPAVIADPS